MDDSTFYRAVLRKNKLVIHSLTDPIPPGDFSRVIETLIDYANEEKRRQTSRDVKRGLADRTRAGFAPGGPPPRGYMAEREEIGLRRDGQPRMGTKWVPDPELAPLVILAFKMRADGCSLPEIMAATREKLYKNKNCFSTFFSNKSYLGIATCGDLEFENHHQALINLDTWKAVRQVQENAKRNMTMGLSHPRRLASPSLLSGLAVCIHCGTPMLRDVAGPKKWNAYLCGKKRSRSSWHACEGRQIGALKADKAIIDAVLTRVLTPDFVTELLNELRATMTDTAEIERLEDGARRDLSNCERVIGKLVDALEDNISPAITARLKDRENERAGLIVELATFQAKREAALFEISSEALSLVLDVWRGEIEQARDQNDIHGLQNLLRMFVNKIELGYNQARIWYTYPIDAFVNTSNGNTLAEKKTSGPLIRYRIMTKALAISWSK
jgi:hypothetical protein